MTATINITAEITEFARRVREHLSDLTDEEVDDLTDGLEADMSEAFAENPSHALPNPSAYALELRTAAGLPVKERSRQSIGSAVRGIADSLRMSRESIAANLRRSPAMAKALDALVDLRPAWWLARAWVAYVLISAVFGREGSVLPYDVLGWILLLSFVAVSVQWGRERWLRFGWFAGLIVIGNIAAVILLLPMLALANATTQPYDDAADVYYEEPEATAGITLDGKEVTNIFGYDAGGAPLKGVQLFDQDGNPLRTSVQGGSGCVDAKCMKSGLWFPSTLETGAKAWNVFPMQMVPATENTVGELKPDEGAMAQDRPSPFIKVPALFAPKTPAPTPEKVEKGNE